MSEPSQLNQTGPRPPGIGPTDDSLARTQPNSGPGVRMGIIFGLLAYVAFSISDAGIRMLEGRIPAFELAFFYAMFSLVLLVPTEEARTHWRSIFITRRPVLVLLRAFTGVAGMQLAIHAFTNLPFAEAYALIFLMPIFVTILSIVILHEQVGWYRWGAVIVGLLGVVVIVRPGFRTLELAHLSALAVALVGASTVIILRILGPTERRITLIGVGAITALLINGVLMIPTLVIPSWQDMLIASLGGMTAGGANLLLIQATRLAPANHIAPLQYSQTLHAVVLGILIFNEYPDTWIYVGLAIVMASGSFTFIREEIRMRWSRQTRVQRPR